MSDLTINGAVPVWTNKQWNVLYEGENAPKYPQILGILLKTVEAVATLPLYYSGRILSIITSGANTGMFINYDPDGSGDQLVPTHIIADQWVNGLAGLDTTSLTTKSLTFNKVNVAPLGLTGTTLYRNTIVANNTAACVTGFEAYYVIETITNIKLAGVSCPIITIQGVAP